MLEDILTHIVVCVSVSSIFYSCYHRISVRTGTQFIGKFICILSIGLTVFVGSYLVIFVAPAGRPLLFQELYPAVIGTCILLSCAAGWILGIVIAVCRWVHGSG